MFGSAESEHLRLNGEIISEEFQPMRSQFTNVTDRQTTCDCKTAFCTKVHRAVTTAIITCFKSSLHCRPIEDRRQQIRVFVMQCTL